MYDGCIKDKINVMIIEIVGKNVKKYMYYNC